MGQSNNEPLKDKHFYWMKLAIEQAKKAATRGEVPIGAVLVDLESGESLSSGFNRPIGGNDPTAHAEIVAIRQAAKLRKNYRLPGTALYVTIEPCTMCVGALIHARVDLVVFGAREPRAGAVVSGRQLSEESFYNHRLSYLEGIMAEECGAVLTDFFERKRDAN
tara:strand:- start:2165 stop:2656 length:492 start_codon:yes stop_codon:yes gene_type:complete